MPDETQKPAIAEVDELTVRKCASLAAYQFGDQQIAETLVISVEQVMWARDTQLFKDTFAAKTFERAQAQIDLTEGWDSAETNALATVLEALQWSKDPKFALNVAVRANAAKRNVGLNARTIDPSKAGTSVHLTFNTRFVQQTIRNDNKIINTQTIDRPKVTKMVDMPTPSQVTDLLAPARPLLEKMHERKTASMADALGFGNLDEND